MPERYALTIISVGGNLQWLASQDQILAKAKGDRQITECLKDVKEFLQEIEFKEEWVFNELDAWIKKLSRYKSGKIIDKKDADQLSYDASTWLREVLEYLSNLYYWEVKPDGVFDVGKLVEEETATFFKKKTYWRKLSKATKHDLDEACFSLAFELPTAAAFLIMRATEDVLRKLYFIKTKKTLKGFIKWASITRELTGKVDNLLIDNLDHLRRNYRNPVSHPEKTYEQKESERLLQAAIGVIEQMIDEM
ncbi:MAG: hypothetical protein JRI79_08065 [Deltaproteobacteria bacterium]|nr:hypothetical protein [Deltaproteobacteria bacterium]